MKFQVSNKSVAVYQSINNAKVVMLEFPFFYVSVYQRATSFGYDSKLEIQCVIVEIK